MHTFGYVKLPYTMCVLYTLSACALKPGTKPTHICTMLQAQELKRVLHWIDLLIVIVKCALCLYTSYVTGP